MADAITTTYKFTLPEVGASDDTWGLKLNANWSGLETLLKTAFEGGSNITLGKLKAANMPSTGVNDVIFTGNPAITIQNNTAQLRFVELDQTDPNGRYRLLASGGNFSLQRPNAEDWASFINLFSYNRADDIVEIGPKIQFNDQVRPAEFYQPTIKSDSTAAGAVLLTLAISRPWRISQRGSGDNTSLDLHSTVPGDNLLNIVDHIKTNGIRIQPNIRKISGLNGPIDIEQGTIVNFDQSVNWPSFGIRRASSDTGATFAMSGSGSSPEGWSLTYRPSATDENSNSWQIRWQNGSPNMIFRTDGTVDGSKITGLQIGFFRNETGADITRNSEVAGTGLRYASAGGTVQGPNPSGTWICLGFAAGTGADANKTSLFIKKQ